MLVFGPDSLSWASFRPHEHVACDEAKHCPTFRIEIGPWPGGKPEKKAGADTENSPRGVTVTESASRWVCLKSGLPCGEGGKGLALALGISGEGPGQGASPLAGPASRVRAWVWVWFFFCTLPSPRCSFQIATPRIMSGNGKARKVLLSNHRPPKSPSSESHQTQLVGFREDPRRPGSVFLCHCIPLHSALFGSCRRAARHLHCYTVAGAGLSVCLSFL